MDVFYTVRDLLQSHVLSACRTGNPVIDGLLSAVVLSLFAWCSHTLRRLLLDGYHKIANCTWGGKKQNNVQIEEFSLHNHNEAYLDFCWFITQKEPCKKGALRIVQFVRRTYDRDDNEKEHKSKFLIPQEDEIHTLTFEGSVLTYKFYKIHQENQPDRKGVYVYQKGSDCMTICRFLDHIQKERQAWIDRTTWSQTIFTNRDGKWVGIPSHNSKQMNTVVLSGNKKQVLEKDLQDFLDSEEWYKSMGIAYTRGYLLHGKPGCGKTSVIKAISCKLQMDIYYINLSVMKNDNEVRDLFETVPVHSMIVMEDIDCMADLTHHREQTPSSVKSQATVVLQTGPTLSCLLNALDGLSPQHGRILMMTTNHIEKLDKALIRPGRCDLIIELKMCDKDMIMQLYELFYSRTIDENEIKHIPDNTYSPAEISGIFMRNRFDSVAGLKELKLLNHDMIAI